MVVSTASPMPMHHSAPTSPVTYRGRDTAAAACGAALPDADAALGCSGGGEVTLVSGLTSLTASMLAPGARAAGASHPPGVSPCCGLVTGGRQA
ncbi:hypothetical protein GCM10022214_34410 [Actinomadura miaoliensis]|uniref:Uncharacterized protein n=1 Tax=Actinomadura miaoliensis TaxID=430685 RepID=A0ABP7VU84_9ACTN